MMIRTLDVRTLGLDAVVSALERSPELRLTIGKVDVSPGSINTVPAAASITVDVRHAEAGMLDECEALLREYCAEPRHGCSVALEQLMSMRTTWFDEPVKKSLRAAAQVLAQSRFQLRLQAADRLRQLDDRLEKAVVERADLDGVVGAVTLGGGVSETGHADDHAGARSLG